MFENLYRYLQEILGEKFHTSQWEYVPAEKQITIILDPPEWEPEEDRCVDCGEIVPVSELELRTCKQCWAKDAQHFQDITERVIR